jgi:hypothetical protein
LPYPSQLVNRPCYGAKRRIAIHDVALTIIFDLDGTLIDTAPDLVETLNVILSLSPLAYDRARNLVGGGDSKPKGVLVRRQNSKNCLPISLHTIANT